MGPLDEAIGWQKICENELLEILGTRTHRAHGHSIKPMRGPAAQVSPESTGLRMCRDYGFSSGRAMHPESPSAWKVTYPKTQRILWLGRLEF